MNGTQGPDHRGTLTSGGSPEEIQRDVERTRAQLGETADALAQKLDPRVQVKEKAGHARERGAAAATHARALTRTRARRARQAGGDLLRRHRVAVLGVTAGVSALVVVAVVWRRTG